MWDGNQSVQTPLYNESDYCTDYQQVYFFMNVGILILATNDSIRGLYFIPMGNHISYGIMSIVGSMLHL